MGTGSNRGGVEDGGTMRSGESTVKFGAVVTWGEGYIVTITFGAMVKVGAWSALKGV